MPRWHRPTITVSSERTRQRFFRHTAKGSRVASSSLPASPSSSSVSLPSLCSSPSCGLSTPLSARIVASAPSRYAGVSRRACASTSAAAVRAPSFLASFSTSRRFCCLSSAVLAFLAWRASACGTSSPRKSRLWTPMGTLDVSVMACIRKSRCSLAEVAAIALWMYACSTRSGRGRGVGMAGVTRGGVVAGSRESCRRAEDAEDAEDSAEERCAGFSRT
mmetsp:Transcript_11935/g.37946  ORF Transcript_11935/g.37946 Transcript_11935/m.37946 type:complete len:219 (+) Transcript_11935:437-1093(+)